ncbi:hypothetical protein AMELA_G00025670, partial [Ameiurus melas]
SLPPSLPLSFSRTLSPLHLTSNQSVLPLLSTFSHSLSLSFFLYISIFLYISLSPSLCVSCRCALTLGGSTTLLKPVQLLYSSQDTLSTLNTSCKNGNEQHPER